MAKCLLLRVILMMIVVQSTSCEQGKVETAALPLPEDKTATTIDRIKSLAAPGDLLVRLGDDILSYQIKFLNEKDQSFSHAGIIIEKERQKFVAHIAPDDSTLDVIRYIPIDSFLNPVKNLSTALYRYNLSMAEKASLLTTIESYRNAGIRFDWLYDLETNGEMYCSEMISKALGRSTADRLQFKNINVPPKMRPLLVKYFKGKLSPATIASRKIMTIDNLYRIPECKKIVQLTLKSLPGQ